MIIGGFQKFSLIDFPERTSSIVFTQGCPFRCAYCHNPELIPFKKEGIDKQEILCYLKKEQKLIDGVCITGGEPTLQEGLEDFLAKLKEMGFAVKLDTNGIRPDVVSRLIHAKLIDYVAMDLKHVWEKYSDVIRVRGENIMNRCKETFHLLQTSGIAHEFRTTVFPGVHTEKDFFTMAGYLKDGEKYFIQKPGFAKNLDPSLTRDIGFDVHALIQNIRASFPQLSIELR
ncbi:anaerobic ribonucleoside-triphosphate reductase activating protein [Candidatus Uhrbacteria bacterium]|nr:anaerobic ribonucleoside-triphosphate reductase activating protein [Candidatus Uhrbacteria bacterium]